MSRKSKKPASSSKPRGGGPASASVSAAASASHARNTPAVWAVCAALFVAAGLVFGRSVAFGFVDYDDPAAVSENPFVNQGLTLRGIAWAFTHTELSSWVPLTSLSHMLDCQIFGLWAGGHHLVNILLHAATSVVLFLVLRSITGSLWRCALVAALFALHPLRVESVAWITERKDVLSGFFFVLTLGAYALWARQPDRGRVWVFVFLTLGLLSKAMLITTPFVLLLLDYWPLQRSVRLPWSRLVKEKIPLLLLCLGAAIAQILVDRSTTLLVENIPFAPRIANAVVATATYIVQLFWPENLAVFYPFPMQGVDVFTLLASCVLLIGVSLAAHHWRRQAPWFAMGWLWYLVMLAPVLGFIQVGESSHADRYTYLSQIGLYVITAWALGVWCAHHQQRRVLAAGFSILALAALSVAAFHQTGFWKDTETLWQRALAFTPNNDTAHYNIGVSRLRDGRLDEAILHFEKALEANPRYADAHINLGRVLLQQGKPQEAASHYHKALDIRPGFAEARYNLGLVLAQMGKMDDAIAQYQKALEIQPAYFDARNNLGSALLQAGKVDEAIKQYQVALRIAPGSAKAHNNLAAALVQKKRLAEAVTHYQKVLEVEPDHQKALINLAWLHATTADPAIRDGARALMLAKRAQQLAGDDQRQVLRTLAAAYAEAGQFEEALQSAQRALDLASTQGNDSLAKSLRGDIELYRAGKPLR